LTSYKTLDQILSNTWDEQQNLNLIAPSREFCTTWLELTYKDIRVWETIYHMQGGISVYAAWDPYTEFYIIVHELFKHLECGIEQYYGPQSSSQVKHRCKKLGVILPENQIWINKDLEWMY
jgi:hypothetical protein